MRLSLSPKHKIVELDGEAHEGVELPDAPADVLWLHWDEDHGEIEFDNSRAKTAWDDRKGNEYITALPSWAQSAVPAWQARKQAKAAERQQFEAAENVKRQEVMARGKADEAAREEAMFRRFEARMRGGPP